MKNQKAIDRIIVKVAIDISKAVKGLEEYRKKVAEKRDIEEELRQQIEDLKCCGNCRNQNLWHDGDNRCVHNMTEDGCKTVDPTKKTNYWEGLEKA
ncbi:MAG: hypothetical protein GY797_27100 [Deltaproteobacteria bacterium]|nr:hypothetical protein [Deltaproteobacteria bacterium]